MKDSSEISIDNADPLVPLPLRAMRLAEKAHRGACRKAPAGEDRPDYFLHPAEVAWRLQVAGMSEQVVAAGFLHDTIEDCDFTQQRLADEIGDPYVAELVNWVSEPEKNHNSWQARNAAYRERLAKAPDEAIALSCADKTANIGDMLRLVRKGYGLSDFLSVGAIEQLAKFQALRKIFDQRIPATFLVAFDAAVAELWRLTAAERGETS